AIKQENPQAVLYFVLGSDAFNNFDHWYKWREIFSLCHLVLIQRPDFELTLDGSLLEEYEQRKEADVKKLSLSSAGRIFIPLKSNIALSSTKVRKGLAMENNLEN